MIAGESRFSDPNYQRPVKFNRDKCIAEFSFYGYVTCEIRLSEGLFSFFLLLLFSGFIIFSGCKINFL